MGSILYTLREAVEVRSHSDLQTVKHTLDDADLEHFIQNEKPAIYASPNGEFLYVLTHGDSVYQYKTQNFEDKKPGEKIPYTPFKVKNKNATLECMALTPDSGRLYVGDSTGNAIFYFETANPENRPTQIDGYIGTPMILAISLTGDLYIANAITDNRTDIYKILAGTKTAFKLGEANPGESITNMMVNGANTFLYAAISLSSSNSAYRSDESLDSLHYSKEGEITAIPNLPSSKEEDTHSIIQLWWFLCGK